jgi:hypothetical protein
MITAYNTVEESPPSNETSYTVPTNSVNQPPSISIIPSQITYQNMATAPIPFAISDAETAASNLTLSVSSFSPVLVPSSNIVFSGSGSNRTVTLTPLAQQTGDTDIGITVSDGDAMASTTFRLKPMLVTDTHTGSSGSVRPRCR